MRHPDYRRLWLGNAVSFIGFQLTAVAVPVEIYSITASSWWVGAIGAVGVVPLIVFGLWGGAVADVADRRTLLIVSSVLLWLCTAGLFVQALLGLNRPLLILGLVALQSAAFAVSSPTRGAIVPRMLPAELVPAANTLNLTATNLGMIAGPLLAGVIIARWSFPAAYALDAVLFGVALYAAARLPALPPIEEVVRTGFRSVLEGLAFIAARPVLLLSFVVDLIAMVFAMPRALFPEAATTKFGGLGAAGWLFAAIAIGAVVGGLLSGWIGRVRRQGLALIVAVIVWGLTVTAAGFVGTLWAAVGLLAVAGAANLVSAVYRQTILQVYVPDALRGRMYGVFVVVVAGGPRLGDLRAGTVAASAGMQASWVSGGIACAVLVTLLTVCFPALFRYNAWRSAAGPRESPSEGLAESLRESPRESLAESPRESPRESLAEAKTSAPVRRVIDLRESEAALTPTALVSVIPSSGVPPTGVPPTGVPSSGIPLSGVPSSGFTPASGVAGPSRPASGRYRPAGQFWRIEAGGHVATVAEVGGGLCSYTVNGVPLVDGYGEDEPCPAGAGQQLVPWPNRIRDGKYQFAGVEEQLAITEPARSNAIHGLLCWTSWQAVDQSPSAVTMIGIIRSQPGYPHTVEVRTCYSISETGLEISVEASNIGIDDCPFGYGAHPYLMVAGVAVDDLRLCLPATERVVFDRRCLPIGRQQVSCTPMDYGLPRKLSQTELDDAFYRRSSRSALLSTEDGRGVELWADEAFPWFQVFTGDTLDPPRRRRAVAIEPMSCPPDAFNSGVDLVVLSPGEVWRGRWGIRPLF